VASADSCALSRASRRGLPATPAGVQVSPDKSTDYPHAAA